ncbi:MAG: hypothetical protein RR313_01805 [Anaerovoracaceae bacterium]
MKRLPIGSIYKAVRACMDEIGFNDADFIGFDKDNSELDLIIHNKIIEAIRHIELNAPLKYLDGISLSATFNIGADLVATIALPDDFLRVVSVKVNTWNRASNDVIYENDAEYFKQSDVYARGTYESPIVAIVTNSAKLYSCKTSSDTLEKFIYIPSPIIEKNEEIESVSFCPKCENAIINYIAGLTKQVLRDASASQHFENAKEYLQ